MIEKTEQEQMLVDYVGEVEAERVITEINDSARELVTSLDPQVFNITKVPEVSISERIRLTKESLLAAYLSGHEDCEAVHCAQGE